MVNSGQNTPPQSLYWWSKPVYPQTRAAEESGSFLEQDSTEVPKFAFCSFCPCGNLVGECLPQTLLSLSLIHIWYRHSQSKGGGPVDFVMEFFGKSFTEAVELLTGEKGAAPPPDRPCPASLSDFRLPPPNSDNRTARNYLTAARRIDEDVTGFFFARGDIYEDAAHHNAVFVGRDEDGIPRYAHSKGTAGNFRLDVKGSDKAFNFCYRGEGERLFVFEAPVDLLSFLCLFKKAWQKQSYLSLGGVGEKALLRFLSDRPNIKTVFLCLDSDEAGNDA